MLNQLLLWSMLLAPLASLFLLDKDSLKYYMPAAVFTALLVTMIHEVGYYFQWWVIHEAVVPWGRIASPSVTLGLFFVGTLWIIYFTYRNLLSYMITQTVFNGVFAFLVVPHVLEPRGIARYVHMHPAILWLLGIALAFVIYRYQKWQEGALVPLKRPKKKETVVIDMQHWLSRKQRIR